MDTVGWDDAECEDDETFKDILRFIDKYNITKVHIHRAGSFGVQSRFTLYSLNCTVQLALAT